jgi:2-oxoglutarate dehydrogenase E2 component (dihydrolipoamide succinyltransferase)
MEIRVPSVGESVVQAMVSKWHKKDGEAVVKDELLCDIETDKITVELNAEAEGILFIKVQEGETVEIGAVIGIIEEGQAASKVHQLEIAEKPAPLLKEVEKESSSSVIPAVSPVAGRLAQEKGTNVEAIPGTGNDEEEPEMKLQTNEQRFSKTKNGDTRITRKPMPPIRKRIAEQLLSARQQTAMLTTFNEADMGQITELRRRHKESFQEKHGVSLGLMPFFVKACAESLKEFPEVNASIEGDDILYHHYCDIGIAIGAEKGLVVPVLRNADQLSFSEIEQAIASLVEKTKSKRLELSDLLGGTFTISNGGVYGSLFSTPILNPSQSGILGMHAIQERPIALNGQITIRPMMYLALSYDHRLIDGRVAVGFLHRIKAYIEEPEELFLEE